MAIYELTLYQTYGTQRCLNRFNYFTTSDEGVVNGSFALAAAFGLAPVGGPTTVFGRLKTLLNSGVTFNSYKCMNLYNPEDFTAGGFATTQVGLHGTEGQSPINSFGFISSQTRTDIASGTKRFVGVSEDTTVQGGAITPSFLTGDLQPFAVMLGSTLEFDDEGNTWSFVPVVLSREAYTTPSGKTAYRKYATEAAQIEHMSVGGMWSAYPQARSQVSRQYGRGQ